MKGRPVMGKISWFRTSVGEEEAARVSEAMLNECVSMGRITEEFEDVLKEKLGVPYGVAVPSGSVALLMSLMALGIGRDDEVIVPNRGWIAAAHAVYLTGAKVVLVDVRQDLPIMDVDEACRKVTSRTRAIIPVHLNGRAVDMKNLLSFCKARKIAIIEDACQSLFSRYEDGYLGTQGEMGCFSFGMAKLVATGQGGLVVTRDKKLYQRLRALRNHGVNDNFTQAWYQFGFNFKFTDVQAAIGLGQLKRTPERIEHLKKIYGKYERGLSTLAGIRIIPVNVKQGELPLFVEALVDRREELIQYLKNRDIQARHAVPDLDPAKYLGVHGEFPNSRMYHRHGVFLPGGPEQPIENVERVIQNIKEFLKKENS